MSNFTSPVTPRPEGEGFPRSARIREGRDFAFVRKTGRLVQGHFLRVSAAAQPGDTRFGFITSRRVGPAVTRNRVRRRLREICRRCRSLAAPDLLVVIIAKPAAATASYEELRGEWLLLARRLSILPRS